MVPLKVGLEGSYSWYFLVQEKGVKGLHPILDLHALMLIHAALILMVRPGNWFTAINLRDTCFHIPNDPHTGSI